MDSEETSTCRVCLRTELKSATKTRSIFDKHRGFLIADKICSITDVKIRKGDGLPDVICSKCLQSLGIAFNFKVTCEKSNKLLLTSLKEQKPGKVLPLPDISKKYAEKQESKECQNDNKDSFPYDVNIFPNKCVGIKQEKDPEPFEFNSELESNAIEFEIFPSSTAKLEENFKIDPEDEQYKVPFDDDDKKFFFQETPINEGFHRVEIGPSVQLTASGKRSRAINLNLECNECGEFFKSKCKLRVHWKKVHKLQNLVCPKCKLRFKSQRAYDNHTKNRSMTCKLAEQYRIEGEGKSRIFHCKICSHSSRIFDDLRYHLNVHTGHKPFVCKLCDRGFTQLSSLHDHQERVHKQYKVEITCQFCGKQVKGRSKVYKHLQTHRQRNIQCDICKAFFKTKCALRTHLLIHDGVKKYVCDKCGASFAAPSNLYNHNKIVHEKHILIDCGQCGYKSHRNEIIKRHRMKHTDKNFACSVCGAFFDSTERLAKHQRRHFAIRNYECPDCGKKFLDRKALWKHVKLVHKRNSGSYPKPSIKKEILIDNIEIPIPELT